MTVAEGTYHDVAGVGAGLLQWGRNLTVAEGASIAGRTSVQVASMGPQLDSCGRLYVPLRNEGLAARLQWGRNLTVAEGVGAQARAALVVPLQWGRNLTVAEG